MRTFPSEAERLNPYPFFAEMQQRHPVVFDEQANLWAVYRHTDVMSALGDPEGFASSTGDVGPVSDAVRRRFFSLIAFDPPSHIQMRKLVTRAFTPSAVARLEGHIAAIVDDLLGAVADTGRTDLIADVAGPLPTIVIAELLGVPAADLESFRRWSNAMADTANALVLDPANGAKRMMETYEPMEDYLRMVIAERRRRPMDDLITGLLAAQIDGVSLDEIDLVAFCALLLIAGNLTTTHLIGNAVFALLAHPAELTRFLAHPERVPDAIEELLRYDSPILALRRFLRADRELGGKQLRKGQGVMLWLGAANRDPAVFPDPDRLDLGRKPAHMAFAYGAHYCLGAPLARLETRIALPAILRRLPELALAEGTQLEATPGFFMHGLTSLPLEFRAR